MKVSGPMVTLAAGALVAATLLGLNVTLRADPQPVAAASADTPSAAAGTPAPSSAATSAPATSAPATSGPATSAADGPSTSTPSAGTPVTAPKVSYAGRVDGGGPFVALVVQGDKAIAYVCDGKRLEAWLWGTVEGDHLQLHGAKGTGSTTWLAAGKARSQLVGAVVLGSGRWTFALDRATKPAGLYRATTQVRGAKVVAGWVVLADGEQVGLATTDDGRSVAAPPLDPDAGTAVLDGTPLTAVPADPSPLTEAGL
jgi:hypothetical protein